MAQDVNVGQINSERFLVDALDIHDQILSFGIPTASSSINFPFLGRELWDIHFIKQCLVATTRARTGIAHLVSSTPEFSVPGLLAAVASVKLHPPSVFYGKLQGHTVKNTSKGMEYLLPPGGLLVGDAIILDDNLHFQENPLAIIMRLRNRLPRGCKLIVTLPISIGPTMDLYQKLGYVIIGIEDIKSFHSPDSVCTVFEAGPPSVDWPQFIKGGLVIEKLLRC